MVRRFTFLALAVAALVLDGGCGRAAATPSKETVAPPRRVTLVPVRTEARSRPVRASGLLVTRDEVRLAFKVGGVVRSAAVEEGATVRKGQVLATLDLREIDAQVAQAEAMTTKAERDWRRTEALRVQEVATPVQAQDARSALDVARAQLEVARFNRRFAVIAAPADGRVLKRLAEPGELVAAGAPVYVVSSPRRGWIVKAGVADRDVLRVAVGDEARVSLDAYPDGALAARVTDVAAAASTPSGLFEVTVQVDDGGRPLKSGMVARIDLVPARRDTYRVVPLSSVLEGDGRKATVWTVDASARARRVPVELAFLDGGDALVARGLDDVARVVAEGAGFLTDGLPVRE